MSWILSFYFLVAVCSAEDNQVNVTVCENDGNVIFECQNSMVISIMEVVDGTFKCINDKNIECSKTLYETLNSSCHEQNMCNLTTESLFPKNCQRAAKYLEINYTCICPRLWHGGKFNHTYSTCTSSLSNVTCRDHGCHYTGIQLQITSITVDSSDSTYCFTCNMEEIKQSVIFECNGKETCSNPTSDKFCLFHQSYATIKYQCKDKVVENIENTTITTGSIAENQTSPDANVQEMSNQITAKSINFGTIVGIPIGVLFVICIALMMTLILLRRSKWCSQNQQNEQVLCYQNGDFRDENEIVAEDNAETSTANSDKFTSEPGGKQFNKNEPPKSIPCSTNSSQPLNGYFILDPNETKCDKTNYNSSTVPYSEIKHENRTDKQDWQKLNEDGVYDKAFSNRYKEDATNIYSHSLDDIYDVSTKNDRHFEKDETYDHFHSGKSEDDCDINATYRYAANSENVEMLL